MNKFGFFTALSNFVRSSGSSSVEVSSTIFRSSAIGREWNTTPPLKPNYRIVSFEEGQNIAEKNFHKMIIEESAKADAREKARAEEAALQGRVTPQKDQEDLKPMSCFIKDTTKP